ncbi:hypothetical protein [Sphingomonas psychrotolerans]|uniref:Uncharacterized protein n=1 Tax=Sphingomonas psychrotolerans TaxID=1327635 RepID=A0A2K8MBV2_9SPHN|nr:hypothetical protein [Sphingomonas psychrotolerans]ATY31358.1 hypothetical protein CVN68_04655 [Sphingomonas psychrotolerans]
MDNVHLDLEEELDREFTAEETAEEEAEQEGGVSDYVPDPRSLWGSEAARAMLVVLTRRLGPDFARAVSDEMAARTFSYQAGCPDDRSDGATMEYLLKDGFWDKLFAVEPAAK